MDRLAGNPREVPAAAVLDHIRHLLARPMSYGQIAALSGVAASTIRELHVGEQKRLHRENVAKILAVSLNAEITQGNVPAIGAARRLQALYARGHFIYTIAEEAGISRDTVHGLATGRWQSIDHSRFEGICRAYDKLSMTTGKSWKARRIAERNGWAPPLAWDDETIDDPAATPVTDAEEPAACTSSDAVARWLMGESVILDAAGRREAVAYLMEWSADSADLIGERFGMSRDAVDQIWSRVRRRAQKEGGPVPWRRVYLPPVRKTGAVDWEQKAA
jgi:DNA-binding Xre family transcriptional regulator